MGGGVISNFVTTGGNTQGEWGDVCQITKSIHMREVKFGDRKGQDRKVGL